MQQRGSTNALRGDTGWAGVDSGGKQQLIIDGNSGTLTVTDGSRANVGIVSHDGHNYVVYEDSTHLAQLRVEAQLISTGPLGSWARWGRAGCALLHH